MSDQQHSNTEKVMTPTGTQTIPRPKNRQADIYDPPEITDEAMEGIHNDWVEKKGFITNPDKYNEALTTAGHTPAEVPAEYTTQPKYK